ncbi:MAG: hypothetical protein ABIL68_06970 [bacterium]
MSGTERSRFNALIHLGLCFLLTFQARPLFGQDYGASFLEIGVGARALGMGGAFCSVGGDGSAFYWNPAGLAFIKRPQISGMYGPQFGSFKNPLANYHFVGYAQPLPGNAVLAVNWIRLAVDEIPVYSRLLGTSYWDRLHDMSLRPSGEPEGYITDTEDAIFFTFAMLNHWQMDLGWEYHQVGIDIPIGINLKWIRQSLGEGEASGLGLDVGGMIRLHFDEFWENTKLGILSWGIHLQDVTGTKLSWNTKHQDSVPMNVKWGVSYRQPLSANGNFLCLSYDRDSRWRGRNRWGAEFTGFDVFNLRFGLDGGKFTGGVGFRFWVFRVDYAYLSHELDSLHRISCSISL